ncbi:MAG TPA: hypothetical protein VFK40_07105 [Nitrososphaeraceae archaeon]|nr:hypothetical protein [Nitrososphaeraceae archaeon]
MNSLRMLIFLGLLACVISIISLNNSAFAQNSNYKVAAGGGNGTTILMRYMPNFL